jgi:hypothetical protein
VTLLHLLTWIANLLAGLGAHRVSIGSVSDHLGWVQTKHWMIRICERGTKGCGF